MAELSELISRLESVNIMEMTADAVIETKHEYLDLNLSQLAKGIMSNDQPTLLEGMGYQPSTINQKKRFGVGLGSITDRVTLYGTGESYRTADLEVVGDDINVKFTTPYFPEVMQKTSDQIIGLDDENRGEYIEGPFFQAFKEDFQNKTKLDLA